MKRLTLVLIASSSLAAVAAAGVAFKYLRRRRRRERTRKRLALYPKDTVILHQQVPLSAHKDSPLQLPSRCPWAVKIETWLRMAEIPYQNEFTQVATGNDSAPSTCWISVNGIDISACLALDFLTNKFSRDLNDPLTTHERGLSFALAKLCECSLYESLLAERSHRRILSLASWRFWFVQNTLSDLKCSEESGRDALRALDDFMSGPGKRTWLMNGEQATQEDAVLFAYEVQLAGEHASSALPLPLSSYLRDECPHLMQHYEAMRARYWPDWNERMVRGAEKARELDKQRWALF